MNIMPYLRLMRPANIITAMADILAGFAVANSILFIGLNTALTNAFTSLWISNEPVSILYGLAFLLLSTIGLYGGGVVLNDVFDAELDAVERPERPIPSGKVSKEGAAVLGIWLIMLGIGSAFGASAISALIASIVAVLAIVYDKYGKHTILGPINMGMCRGGNLLLGISALPYLVNTYWPIAFIPIAYIAAITTISRGEVHGGDKRALYLAFGLYGLVILAILGMSMKSSFPLWHTLPFLALFAFLIFPPLIRAWQDRQPRNIGLAVKAGVIALIAMDAAIGATFAGWIYGLVVLALLPLSRYLARVFAVT
jgi:4-hydroxybenzoate polyprenyltransferase